MAKAILLAEDSLDDELFFKRIIAQASLNNPIHVVRDGEDAISYLMGEGEFADREKYPLPSVFFLDLKMTRIHGPEVLRWIGTQTHLKGMPVVVLTHSINTREISEAYQMGAVSFLTKPLSRADLDNLIQYLNSPWMHSATYSAGADQENPARPAGEKSIPPTGLQPE